MSRRCRQIAPLFALACASAIAPAALAADAIRDIPFSSPGAPNDQLLLNLYLPGQGTTPIATTIIIVHGGSYNSGSRYEMDAIALALADLGYTVISPDYTLVTNVASYPQPISDILNVVHWVRTEGELINLPNAVILSGISAGSTIAMTAAMAAPTQTFNRLPDPVHRGYTIDGAIGIMGRYDLVWNAFYGIPQSVINYIGVPFSNPSWMQTWTQAAAISYVNANTPPTFLIHGTNDGLVPYMNSVHLYQAFTQANAPVQLALIPGGGHDMSILGPTAALQAQTIAAAAEWIDSGIAPPAPGSCCASNGFCSVSTQVACQWTFNSGGTCSPNPCLQPQHRGACCATTGACTFVERDDCSEHSNGTSQWNADGFCSPNPCPPPLGACCSPSAQCSLTPQATCTATSTWTIGVVCQPSPCPLPTGACCAADGTCQSTIQSVCAAQWTVFAMCAPNPCPQPPGTCCATDGSCQVTLQSECAAQWTISGACAPNPCAQPAGSCCDAAGTCASTFQADCQGNWTISGVCSPNPCPQPIGACCMGAACAVTMQSICAGPNRRFTSINAACNAAITSTPCCHADFDHNDATTVSDIFAYLAGWFSGSLDCCISSPLTGSPNVQDIFDFLGAWFTGC